LGAAMRLRGHEHPLGHVACGKPPISFRPISIPKTAAADDRLRTQPAARHGPDSGSRAQDTLPGNESKPLLVSRIGEARYVATCLN
jgi:hypothetical protein